MINVFKAIFSKDTDPELTQLRKIKAKKPQILQALNEAEATFMLLRLSGKSIDSICEALPCSRETAVRIEQNILRKYSKE